MKTPNSIWPQDADGDVFRRLESDNFDFSLPYNIDFNVDFDTWPPSPEIIDVLRKQYSTLKVYESDDEKSGYMLFVIESKLTYEFVMFIQSAVTELVSPYGGVCESWGVMHDDRSGI